MLQKRSSGNNFRRASIATGCPRQGASGELHEQYAVVAVVSSDGQPKNVRDLPALYGRGSPTANAASHALERALPPLGARALATEMVLQRLRRKHTQTFRRIGKKDATRESPTVAVRWNSDEPSNEQCQVAN